MSGDIGWRCTVAALLCALLLPTVLGDRPPGDDAPEAYKYMMVDDILSGNEYYQLMGLSRDATSKEVRKAFRTLSLQYHPDKRGDVSPEEAERLEALYSSIVRAKEVLQDDSLRALYDTMLSNGIPWVERYYNRYAFRYGAPRTSPFVILSALAAVLTVIQYLYKLSRFNRAVKAAKQSQRYQQAVKRIESEAALGDARDGDAEEDAERAPQISIHGIEPPSIDHLLPVQLFNLPYSVVSFIQRMMEGRKSFQEQSLERALAMGYTEEEFERMKENAERRRKRILGSSKYKKYKRFVKKSMNSQRA